jgi:uncharacterized protein (PEP-CTERM system associated)
VLVLHLFATPLAWGGEWRIKPRLEVIQTFTDNVTLAPQGQEESDAVTEINPIIQMQGTGRRLNVSLNYRLQSLFYAEDSDRNDVRHQLGAAADVELVKERFFLEAGASVRQANILNTGRVARDNVTVTDNRSDVASVSVEPIWRERWGGYADTELRYLTRAFRADTDDISDSNFDDVRLTAQNGRRSTQLAWNIDARYRKEERLDQDDDFEDYVAEGEARWPANREFYLLGVAGYEGSDFSTTRELTDDYFWSLGAGWSPSRFVTIEGGKGENNQFVSVFLNPSTRSSLSVQYQDRAVGSNPGATYDARLQYRTRKARFSGGYVEQTTTAQQTFDDIATFPTSNPFGDAVLDPFSVLLCRSDRSSAPSLTDEVFVRRRFELFGGVRAGKRQDFGLTVFSERFEYEEAGDADEGAGVCGSWNWQFRRRTALTTTFEFDHVDFRESDPTEDKADDAVFRVRLGHTFARQLIGSLEYRYRDRNSSSDEFSYDENRIEARVIKTF